MYCDTMHCKLSKMAEAGGKSFNTVDNKDQLMLVELKDSGYGGYKQELLNDNLDPLATKFILCHACNGLSREACSVGEEQNIMCTTCVPDGASNIPMKQARESVPNIPAKCALVSRGCIWKGDIGNVVTHLDECEYFVVSCSNSCQMILQRLELEEHLNSDCTHRNVTCEHCNGTIQFKDLEKHYKECLEFPLVCPNACGGTFKRKELQGHIDTDCPNTVIACGYKLFGCNVEMKRCELADHNNNNILVHLEFTKQHVTSKHTFIDGTLKQLQEEKVGSNQITEINQNVKEIQTKLVDSATLKTLTDKLVTLETENTNSALKTEVTALTKENTTLKTDVTALKTENTTLKTDVTALKTENTTLKTDVTTLKTDVTTLKTEVTALTTENTTLKTNVTALKSNFETFKTEILAKIPAPAPAPAK